MINWLNSKTGLGVLSVTVAVLLWLVVYLDGTAELDLSVPVRMVNMPAGFSLQGKPVGAISVRVSGPRARLMFMDRVPAPVRLDMSGAIEGEMMIPDTGMFLKFPQDVRVVRIVPSSLKMLVGRSRIDLKPRNTP